MSLPITFTSSSPRFGLPLLFAGQTQKEFYVNQAHALSDALLHPAVEEEQASAPAAPQDGQAWLVSANATGDWAGRDLALASRQAGVWVFTAAQEGMRVFNRSSRQFVHFAAGSWQSAQPPELPTAGTTVDNEARETLGLLIQTLRKAGIFPTV